MIPVLVTVVAAVWLGAVVYYGRRLSAGKVSFGLRVILLCLRGSSLLAIFLLLFHPVKAREARVRRPLHLLFLLDDSASMTLPAADGSGSRLEEAERILFAPSGGLVEQSAQRGFEARVLALSDQHYIASQDQCFASGESTDLAAGLEWARGFGRDQDVAAVVLITDGRQTAASDPVRSASSTEFPVFTIGLGATREVTDLAVIELSVPPSIPSGEEFEAEAIVEVGAPLEAGVKGEFLWDGASVLEVEEEIESASRRVRFSGRLTAEEPGPHRVGFRLESLATEQVTENNQRSRVMMVEEAWFRVLVLAGRPSWEFKFLRRSIEESLRLHGEYVLPRPDGGTVILRDRGDEGSEPEGARVEVHEDRSLTDWIGLLSSAEMVIVQNLPAASLGSIWTQSLERWLAEEGHVLLVLGGEQSFGAGGYGDSAFSGLLPVRCSGGGDDRRLKEHVLRQPREGGRLFAHRPFSRFPFTEVPPLLSVHHFAGVKPGSDVLLEAVDGTGQSMPVLVVHRSGLGYVAAAGWDTVWRWQTIGKSPELLGRFWRTLLLFFLTGQQSGPARLYLADQTFRVGQPIRAWMYLSPALLGEALPDRVRLFLSGEAINRRPVSLLPSSEEPTRYQGTFGIRAPGVYTLDYELGDLQERRLLLVEADSHEKDSLSQDAELLMRVAEAGRGATVSADRAGEVLDMIKAEPRYEVTAHYTFVGRLPWVIFVLVGLLAMEWVIRRRHMLP